MNTFSSSMGWAFKGIAMAFRTQRNFKIQAGVGLGALAAGFMFSISLPEWCIVIASMGMVLMAEVFNTALEALTDLVSPEAHPIAGRVKDLAAGAVLLASIAALVIGLIIFVPYLMS